MQPQQTWTNPALTGTFLLLSSNNGVFRFWCQTNPFGQQEVLTTSLAGWVLHGEILHDDPTIGAAG
jgi:hypothetical protein